MYIGGIMTNTLRKENQPEKLSRLPYSYEYSNDNNDKVILVILDYFLSNDYYESAVP